MTFQEENNNLLKFILNASFLKPWSDIEYKNSLQKNTRVGSLELYVTAACGQNCEYCYLIKNGDKLYPKELRKKETILKNTQILANYILDKLPLLPRIDIFSGEIVGEPLFFEILDILLDCKAKGAGFGSIVIPSNFSFIHSEEKTLKVEEYIEKAKQLNVNLVFSASIDGYVLEDKTRPQKIYKARDEEFYDKTFAFCKKYHYCFHPMISAYGIDDWIENYKWWIEKCEQYDIPILKNVMTLEVRNDDWTDYKIQKYLEFLEFYFQYHLNNTFEGLPRRMALQLIGKLGENFGYTNLLLSEKIQIPSCSIGYQMTVRLGDLAIAPCHRLSYDDFLYGKFIVKDEKIVDVEAYNPFIATKILLSNQRKSHHGCDVCWNKDTCIKGCFGSQKENTDEIFMPVESVCNLLKAKTKKILELYDNFGVIEELKKLKTNPTIPEELIDEYLTMIEKIKKGIDTDPYFN